MGEGWQGGDLDASLARRHLLSRPKSSVDPKKAKALKFATNCRENMKEIFFSLVFFFCLVVVADWVVFLG